MCRGLSMSVMNERVLHRSFFPGDNFVKSENVHFLKYKIATPLLRVS